MAFDKPVIQHLSDSTRAVGMFPVSVKLNDVVQSLEGSKAWLKSGALSFVGSQSNVRKFQEFYGDELEIRGETKSSNVKEYAVKYYPITEPFEHQIRALEFLGTKTSAALFCEQGTGKTKIAIDHLCRLFLNREIDCVVVVAPKGVHKQWVDSELPKHCGIAYEPFVYNGRPKSFVARDPSRLQIISTTYGMVSSKSNEPFWDYLKIEFSNVLLIMDESHFIKEPATKRWKACYKFSKETKYRLALTGTPIASKLTDEWAQLKCVDEDVIGIESKAAFEREYERNTYEFTNFYRSGKRPQDPIERFKEITKTVVFRCTKAELDIAPKTHSDWRFDLTKEQLRQIKLIADELRVSIIEKNLNIEFACMALIKLRQVASGFIIDQDMEVHEIEAPENNPRLIALREIIESHEEQIIVWYHHIQDGNLICKMLMNMDLPYAHYKGSDGARSFAVNEWSKGYDNCRVFVGNPASGGTGLNLQNGGCRLAVFYSHSDNSIQRWQAEDRIHRIGQKGICEYINLIANGSVDDRTLLRVRQKKALADYTLDDIIEDLDSILEGIE